MKQLLRLYLAFLAKILIKIKKPYIIGITGSAGKTTVTSFIVQFLQKEFGDTSVQFSQYHYNGEFGLPLTILNAKTGGKNPLKWMFIFGIFLKRCFQKYPKFLVLEYGIDTPNEMDFLLSIAIPDIAIITPIVSNHIEQFGNEIAYKKEKLKILKAKRIFAHNSLLTSIPTKNVQFFGKNLNGTDIIADNIKTSAENIQADIFHKNQIFNISLSVFGEYQIENILPLFGIADILNIQKNHIGKYTPLFHTEEGRGSIFHGNNNAIIIDGTYNGGLLSMERSIESIAKVAENRAIILLLGDMRELGTLETESHISLANSILQTFSHHKNIHIFLVGRVMQKLVFPMLQEKIPTEIFLSSRMAGKKINYFIKNHKNDCILFAKGSQNTIFLEEGIKVLLPESQHKYLCRQSKDWLQKKEKFFKTVE